ncbi:serine protease [Sulfuracidifex metallicus]|nr:serine protease [Sulfuracidifex metallicus]WOE49906.1 serine protease [Sulfuracidifex metallicus DSM 6482 = JCM 9184]
MEIKKSILLIILVALVVVGAVGGFLIGQKSSAVMSTSDVTAVTETSTSSTVEVYAGDPPASVGNSEDYLINPVFPAHTIASQYGYVTLGNGRVFIGSLYNSGNGYLAGAKGAAVVASMFAGQPLSSYDYYLYITAPSTINVGGAVKTDSATVMFLASMLGQESYLNKSMYFLGDVGLEGYMYSTGVVYQRIVQLNQGGIYYLVVPKMMALAEGQNYQMAQEYAKAHNETLYTVCDIPQIYQIETSQGLPNPHGYIDFQANLSSGYNYMLEVYKSLYSHANSTAKEKASSYFSEAQKLANEGQYYQFYLPDNPMTLAIEAVYNGTSLPIDQAALKAQESGNLWAIETAAEAEYLYHGNMTDKIDSLAWAGLSESISAGPTITSYGLYQGVYNGFLVDMYAAEYYDAVTGSQYGNVTLLTNVMKNPNLVYDYGFFANYYAKLAMNFSEYFLKQLNSTSKNLVETSIQKYMENEVPLLEDQAAYYDGPSLVAYIFMNAGNSTYALYHAMPFIRMSENTEELTWYNSV